VNWRPWCIFATARLAEDASIFIPKAKAPPPPPISYTMVWALALIKRRPPGRMVWTRGSLRTAKLIASSQPRAQQHFDSGMFASRSWSRGRSINAC